MIEVKTIVTEKLMRTFTAFQTRQKLWVPVAAALALIALGIILFFMPDFGVVGGVLLIGLGILMPALYYVAAAVMTKSSIKNSPLLKSQMTQIFRFSDKILINESSKFINSNDLEYAWELLYRVVETPDAFYFYINKAQAFIVDRNGFTMGSPRELHELIAQNVDAKIFRFPKRFYK